MIERKNNHTAKSITSSSTTLMGTMLWSCSSINTDGSSGLLTTKLNNKLYYTIMFETERHGACMNRIEWMKEMVVVV